jgi:hypothetical protein
MGGLGRLINISVSFSSVWRRVSSKFLDGGFEGGGLGFEGIGLSSLTLPHSLANRFGKAISVRAEGRLTFFGGFGAPHHTLRPDLQGLRLKVFCVPSGQESLFFIP